MKLSVDIKKKLGSFSLDIRFEAEEGVFALLGASGSGKSMTLKCIAGIERPDEGRIILGDRVLFDSTKKIDLAPQKRRVGYMFQDYALFPNMTVRQNVAVGLAGRNVEKQKSGTTDREESAAEVENLLRRFRVDDLAEHYPAQLSGGQKQRVAMARLMGQKPDVILLDEPFSALDSHLKWQLEQEMKEALADAGKPTIFVSHDRDEVYHLADVVCCVGEGRAETIQPMKDFFHNPQTRTAAILSGCKNVAAAEILDARTLRIAAWGLDIRCPKEIPTDTKHIGLRAHSIVPLTEAYGVAQSPVEREALIPVTPLDVTVQEDPFEWTVFFRVAPDAPEKIQWKTAKEEGRSLAIPSRFGINPAKIMLLR